MIGKDDFSHRILKIVKDIARALVDYIKNKKQFKLEQFKKFQLKHH